jgi:hypothetical protein
MASKSPQTMAKRARERAVKERRERKRAKKAESAAARAAARESASSGRGDEADIVALDVREPAPPGQA